ncbi:MAG: MoaD/ThiS family protein [Nitrospirae bacterium]|nr:MoaD/ThiS family protein [Nitrospirota bacterium]
MAVKVRIPTPLQRLTGGNEVVEAMAGSVIAIVRELDSAYPGIAERISDGGKIRRFVNVYVNEEDIRFLQAEETPVKDGQEMSIVPAIAGGTGRADWPVYQNVR